MTIPNVFIPGEKVFAESVNENFSDQDSRLDSLVSFYEPHYMPVGIISMWAGEENTVPSGWAVCDGQNGTIDLRNRFIVGVGDEYDLADTGGQTSVTLAEENLPSHDHGVGTFATASSGAHTHTLLRYTLLGFDCPGGAGRSGVNTSQHTSSSTSSGAHQHGIDGSSSLKGSGTAHENRPPYYALYYIMLVGES